MANTTQTYEWNGASGEHWVAYEERYNAAVAPYTEQLFAAAAVGGAERVLDVGCGCGETTRLAAARAPDGAVLGVDLSAAMLAVARRRAADAGLRNVTFEQGDVQVHELTPASRDLALSRNGVMFFDDPVAAFANVGRALRRGGRLMFLCWRAPERNAYSLVPRAVLSRHVDLPELPPPGAPGPNSLAAPERIREVLGAAGFQSIQLAPVDEAMELGRSVADAMEFVLGRPWVADALADAGPATAQTATAELRDALAERADASGAVRLAAPAWLVSARRAG